MTIKEIEEELEILSQLLESGSFIKQVLDGKDPEYTDRAVSTYVETVNRIRDAEGQLQAELNKAKSEIKHRLASALSGGDLERERAQLCEEYKVKISASVSRDYDAHKVRSILEESGALDEAIKRGAIDLSPRVVGSKMTKAMKALVEDAGAPKLSRVMVTRVSDE